VNDRKETNKWTELEFPGVRGECGKPMVVCHKEAFYGVVTFILRFFLIVKVTAKFIRKGIRFQ
jgi:hypothetical protein